MLLILIIFLDQVQPRQKYYAPQVQPDWSSNSWSSGHDSTLHVTETPALTTWPSVISRCYRLCSVYSSWLNAQGCYGFKTCVLVIKCTPTSMEIVRHLTTATTTKTFFLFYQQLQWSWKMFFESMLHTMWSEFTAILPLILLTADPCFDYQLSCCVMYNDHWECWCPPVSVCVDITVVWYKTLHLRSLSHSRVIYVTVYVTLFGQVTYTVSWKWKYPAQCISWCKHIYLD